jgi:hypothetical protein
MSSKKHLSRRQFGTLVGGAALALPFLPAWMRAAIAQPTSAPVRFLALRTPHGVDRDYWIPRRSDGSEPGSADDDLEALTFEYPDAVLTPLMPWRSKITILDGLDTQVCKEGTRADRRRFHGHQEQGALLTGAQPPEDRQADYDGHPSLDFYLHARLPAPALLTACVEGTGDWKCMSYDDAGRPRNPEADPRTLFRQAFPADFVPPTPEEPEPGEPPPPVIDYSRGEARISAYGIAAIERMRVRLDGAERVKLDAHLEAMMRLSPTPGMPGTPGTPGTPMLPPAYCTTSGMDVPTRGGNVGDVAGVAEVTRAHARVIAQAFACGRARVGTLQILNDYPNYFSDLPEVRTPQILGRYGSTFRFHENLVHDYWGASGTTRAELRVGYCAGLRWSASHVAAVLEELDSMPDPLDPMGGSILDNTIVFWHNEFGHDGHDNQHTRHPAVIAGGGGRTLRLGRYLRLRNIASDERVPHNRLLTSIAQAMGLSDVEYFGDRDLGSRAAYRGPLAPLMV